MARPTIAEKGPAKRGSSVAMRLAGQVVSAVEDLRAFRHPGLTKGLGSARRVRKVQAVEWLLHYGHTRHSTLEARRSTRGGGGSPVTGARRATRRARPTGAPSSSCAPGGAGR